jgi:hypothetical protein
MKTDQEWTQVKQIEFCLDPCPGCKGRMVFDSTNSAGYQVRCYKCGLRGPSAADPFVAALNFAKCTSGTWRFLSRPYEPHPVVTEEWFWKQKPKLYAWASMGTTCAAGADWAIRATEDMVLETGDAVLEGTWILYRGYTQTFDLAAHRFFMEAYQYVRHQRLAEEQEDAE